ncbi:MAG: hypothetical protein ONB23_03135 [candidate division KSB1 bacterium]|nr:hypothetical protein [candidate division KSB1 bacterium]
MRRRGLFALFGILVIGCAGQAPKWVRVEAVLLPDAEGTLSKQSGVEVLARGYRLSLGECRLEVEPLPDGELNRRFLDVSFRGANSANPYTYGNWVDPELGYTPPRFAVFHVAVSGGRGCLRALRDLVLVTDQGDSLPAYRYPDEGPRSILARLQQDWRDRPSLLDEAEVLLAGTYLRWGEAASEEITSGLVAFAPLDYAVDRVSLLLWRADAHSNPVALAFRQRLLRVDEPSR